MAWSVEHGAGVWHVGDCFDVMATLPDASIDLICTDPPYGTTACKWDSVLPLDQMWSAYWRILKPTGLVIATAGQPFTSALVMSQPQHFKYAMAWDKVLPRGHLNAKKQPLRVLEDILVFGRTAGIYNPQMSQGHKRKVAHTKYDKGGDGSQVYGREKRDTKYDSTERYPTSLISFSSADQSGKFHPTQKPVALFEYLIRTYTDEGMTVLDNTAGSGTTAVAAERSGRRWVCIERDEDYSLKALARLAQN